MQQLAVSVAHDFGVSAGSHLGGSRAHAYERRGSWLTVCDGWELARLLSVSKSGPLHCDIFGGFRFTSDTFFFFSLFLFRTQVYTFEKGGPRILFVFSKYE